MFCHLFFCFGLIFGEKSIIRIWYFWKHLAVECANILVFLLLVARWFKLNTNSLSLPLTHTQTQNLSKHHKSADFEQIRPLISEQPHFTDNVENLTLDCVQIFGWKCWDELYVTLNSHYTINYPSLSSTTIMQSSINRLYSVFMVCLYPMNAENYD